MGSAARTSSSAHTSMQKQAKRSMNTAVENKDLHRAADIGITVLLATQPNGPAKVPMYSYAKHTKAFIDGTNAGGIEQGVVDAGQSVLTAELASGYADMTVTGAQAAISSAAEQETVGYGVRAANKNLQMPSEQAAEDTVAAIMTNGADALGERRKKND